MTRDSGDPGPARRRRLVIVVAAVVLLAAVLSAVGLHRSRDDPPTAGLTVGWGGTEEHPSCVYEPNDHAVDCKITIEGNAPRPETVTVTVTAYADENTSEQVGSSDRSVRVEGTVHLLLHVVVPVEKAPHVDEDGETTCRLSVQT
jgi:hypothetical protein